MEWFKKHDVLIRILCLVTALLMWFYVVSTDSPEIEKEYKNINVTLQNRDKILNNYGMMVTSDDITVNVKIKGRREKVFQLGSADNILVTADVSPITAAGSHRLVYTVTLPVAGLEVTSKEPNYITVAADKKVSNAVPVKVEFAGTAPSGYVYGEYAASPHSIVVEGPDSEISQIASAAVKIDADGVSKTSSWTVPYTFENEDGQPLELSHVTGDVKNIMVTLPVTKTKKIAFEADVLSAPGVDKASASLTFSPAEILVTGEDSVIENLNKINLGTIDLDGIKSGDTVKFPVVLPNGVRAVENIDTVEVGVSLDSIETVQFIINDIRVNYTGDKYSAKPLTSELAVTLRGSKTELAKITPQNVYAIVTLSEQTAGKRITAGKYTIPANIRVSGAQGVAAIGEYHVSVEVEKK